MTAPRGPLYDGALADILLVEGCDDSEAVGYDEVLAAWTRIIRSGLVDHLQGSTQRTAAWLVRQGLVSLGDGEVH